jgi:CHAT domain-containing protein/Tfp pilus assembly protein PilF
MQVTTSSVRAWIAVAIFSVGACLQGAVSPAAEDDAPIEAQASKTESPFAHAEQLERDGALREAALEYDRLAAGFTAAGDVANRFYARYWGTRALFDINEFDAVRQALAELHEIAGADLARQAWVACLEGMLERETGTLGAALPKAELALRLARQSADRKVEVAALGLLQSVEENAGRYSRALILAKERLALEQALEAGGRNEASAWNQLAVVLERLGRYAEAIDAYDHALAINEKRGDTLGVAINQLNQSNVHYATGQYPEAFRLSFAALATSTTIDDTYGIVLVHSNLGQMFRQVGNYAAAREHLDTTFAMLKDFDAPELHIPTYEFLGRLEQVEKNHAAAEQAYLTALRLAEARGENARVTYQKAWLARNAAESGDFQSALTWGEAAVKESDRIGAPDLLVSSMCSQAFVHERAGDLDSALATYKRAIEYIESWLGQLGFGDLKMSLAACHLEVYEGAIRVLIALGRAGEAFDVSERVRARRLLDLMIQTPVHAAYADDGIAELEAAMRSRYPELQANDAGQAARLSQELAEQARELEKRKSARRLAEPVSGTARYPVPAGFAEVQQGLLSPARALLAFFWGEHDVLGWWIEADRITAKRLGTVAEFDQRIAFFRAAMQHPTGAIDWRPAAAGLYQHLVAPLEPGPQLELYLLPDGPLGYVPFAGLLPQANVSPWGATHQLVQGPSAAILLALARAQGPEVFERALLAVGGQTTSATNDSALRGTPEERIPLPFAAQEVADIAALFPAQTYNVLIGADATLERWQDLQPHRYRYLHFATHASVSDRDPLETHLVLPQAGQLGLAAIRKLRIAAELVTLSGCETALGRIITGEGILGLPHAFLAAGARGVLVTLWRVEDRATADFVTQFYTHLRAGAPPAEALRETREQWLSSHENGNAAAWAPFVLIGGLSYQDGDRTSTDSGTVTDLVQSSPISPRDR